KYPICLPLGLLPVSLDQSLPATGQPLLDVEPHGGKVLLLLALLGGKALFGDEEAGGKSEHRQGAQEQEGGGRRPASGPLPQALRRRCPPCEDRFAAEEPLQVVCQLLGAPIAADRLFLEALQADRLQIALYRRIQAARSSRLFLE